MANGETSAVWKWVAGILAGVVVAGGAALWTFSQSVVTHEDLSSLTDEVKELKLAVTTLNEHLAVTDAILKMHGITVDSPPRRPIP